MSIPGKEEVLRVCSEVFAVEWRIDPPIIGAGLRVSAAQAIGPIGLDLERAVDAPHHWSAECDGSDIVAYAYPGGAMATDAELLARGILPGSIEELREVLLALRFNLGQAIEEMRCGYVAATGSEHVYVEASCVR